ncbi:pyridoxal-phosphate dependent enzyme [Qaidamihabitans albus]|uniref:pyridoxal-phosphate dependent enzyme n=1 Tax=Qaidamihabitans albus TaxID=2795733 RepID=UPI0018F1631D|nr:pyridoxal-phosphate dependent enzyme [Qaidamihabitans albus]
MGTGRGLSRFAADLPRVREFVTLGEGDTPCLRLDRLARQLGVGTISAKMESLNPTGSYKDRVAAMSLSLAHARRGWIATSSGNAGVALAAYGARVGLPGFLCLVASAPLEKRLALMPYPVEVVPVHGIGRAAVGTAESELFIHVRQAADRHDLYLGITAHAFNQEGMRGIDTIGYELAEQVPDASVVYVPTGGGGLLTAVARGLEHRGLPARVIACQPVGCAPIARFLAGELSTPEIERCESDISALQLPHPPDGALAAAAVVRSGGWGTGVSDAAVLRAQRLLAGTEGVFVEPASAAALAALIEDLGTGKLGENDHPVLILTGTGSKDLRRFTDDARGLCDAELNAIPARVDNWVAGLSDRAG